MYRLHNDTLKNAEEFFTLTRRAPVTLNVKYFVDHKFCQHRSTYEVEKQVWVMHGQVNMK